MTDGTTGLDGLGGGDPSGGDVERPEGAFATDAEPGMGDHTDPSVGEAPDQQMPDWIEEVLSASDHEQVLTRFNEEVSRREREIHASFTPKLQKAAQLRKEYEAALEKAIRYDALMENPTTAQRLLGIQQGAEAGDPLPTLAELDLTDEQKAIDILRRKLFGGDPQELAREAARQVMGNQPIVKRQNLEAAASQYRSALSEAGQPVSNDQWNAALQAWASDLAEEGIKWEDTNTSEFARNLRPYIRLARATRQTTAPPSTPTLRATPAGTGSRARTKSDPVWVRERRQPTLDELYDSDAGGVTGAEIDRALARERQQLG
jgi:hypothetical protein